MLSAIYALPYKVTYVLYNLYVLTPHVKAFNMSNISYLDTIINVTFSKEWGFKLFVRFPHKTNFDLK